MAIRKIKNKVQNSRAALQSKHHALDELLAKLREQYREYSGTSVKLQQQLIATSNAEVRHNAAAKALDAERERLDGVFAARLQQARNEIAQLSGQVDTLVVRCRRLETDNVNAEEAARQAREGRTNMLAGALVALVLQTVYYEEWYVPVVEFVKGLL